MSDNDVEIMVCCHKSDYYCDARGYLPVQVGKVNATVDLGMTGDDTGDNISHLNPHFCELTAHYWYWKNRLPAKYVGLCHYRRYFAFDRHSLYGQSVINVTAERLTDNPPLIPDMDTFIKGYDIILASPVRYYYPLRVDYQVEHIKEDYDIMRETVLELYPEYSDAWNRVMDRGNKLSHFNMFITRSDIFADYSEWLFKILFEVSRRIKISDYQSQARVYGYMSERLLNVYVRHNGLKVKYLPVYKVGDESNRPYYRDMYSALKFDLISKILIRDMS